MNGPWVRIALAIALLFAMSGGSAQHVALAAPDIVGAVIHFVPFSYTPSEVVIQPGESVEWDGDFSSHPLVSDDGLWTTHAVGTQFVYTFTMTGTFLFHCANHGGFGGVGMSGRVIVKEFPNKIYLPIVLRT
jgi:plastocyanin